MPSADEPPGVVEGMEMLILHRLSTGVLLVGANDLICCANPRACELLNCRASQIVARRVSVFPHAGIRSVIERAVSGFRSDTAGAATTACESVGERKLYVHCAPLDETGRAYQGMLVTITDATECVRAAHREFEAEKMEAMRTLTGGIAHGFNNLMATVLGLASHMKARSPNNDPDHSNLVRIEQAAATAGRLAHQLLEFVTGGRFSSRVIGVADVVARAMLQVRPSIQASVETRCEVPAGLWTVDCDAVQIAQVVVALCSNAIEAMPDGGLLTITGRNVAAAKPPEGAAPPLPPGEYVCLAVEDTGCGMDEATRRRVFEPFFTTKATGYGLSLAAAYSIILSHTGGISVTSAPGKGSTFQLWLPRAQAEEPMR